MRRLDLKPVRQCKFKIFYVKICKCETALCMTIPLNMCKTGNDRRLILTKPYFITCLFVPLLALFNMDLVSEPKKVGSCYSTGLYQSSIVYITKSFGLWMAEMPWRT